MEENDVCDQTIKLVKLEKLATLESVAKTNQIESELKSKVASEEEGKKINLSKKISTKDKEVTKEEKGKPNENRDEREVEEVEDKKRQTKKVKAKENIKSESEESEIKEIEEKKSKKKFNAREEFKVESDEDKRIEGKEKAQKVNEKEEVCPYMFIGSTGGTSNAQSKWYKENLFGLYRLDSINLNESNVYKKEGSDYYLYKLADSWMVGHDIASQGWIECIDSKAASYPSLCTGVWSYYDANSDEWKEDTEFTVKEVAKDGKEDN